MATWWRQRPIWHRRADAVSDRQRILVTGATGYVGGRLLSALLERPVEVRCLARRPEAIGPCERLEVVAGDALDPQAVRRALHGVDVAYYLIHAMGASDDFAERDRMAATTFAQGAREEGVRRIVYLGGLGEGDGLSSHLASRQEVGRLLASTGVPTIEFRASIVIGSGSLSFELVRSLTERLPVMITPRWVNTRAQPIAIEDLIEYLVAALETPADGSVVLEIGGADGHHLQRVRRLRAGEHVTVAAGAGKGGRPRTRRRVTRRGSASSTSKARLWSWTRGIGTTRAPSVKTCSVNSSPSSFSSTTTPPAPPTRCARHARA